MGHRIAKNYKMNNRNVKKLKKSIKFRNTLKLMHNSLSWPKKKIDNYQLNEINKILKYSLKNVKFYYKNSNYKKYSISISSLKKFEQLPFINKKLILKKNKEFISNSIKKKNLFFLTTGGTTGNPLKIWMNKEFNQKSLATTFFYTEIAKIKIGKCRSVRIHGDTINSYFIKNKIFWEKDKYDKKKLIMSCYHLTLENTKSYVEKILEHGTEYIHAYPSAIYLFAKNIKKLKIKYKFTIKCIFTDCEVLYPHQRKLIIKIFGCKVYNTYGHTESSVFGFTINNSKNIFLSPIVGYVELIDQKGRVIKKPFKKGEIVVTGFFNKSFPLIRYRTQDFGSYGSNNHPIKFKNLKEIYGREQDYIINKSKNQIPIGPALFDYNFNWEGIQRYQIVQKKPGEIIFKIILEKNKNAELIKQGLKNSFNKILNFEFKIIVEDVKKLSFTRIGKFRYLIQELKFK